MAGWLAVALGVACAPALAQVYRSVDEAGNVTFSDAPPADAVEVTPVEIEPGPSAEALQAAQERAEVARQQLELQREARAAEEKRAHEARMRRLEEEALRASLKPLPLPPSEPARPTWNFYGFGYPGYPAYPAYPWHGSGFPVYPPPPDPPPPPPGPRSRPKVLDSPLYYKPSDPVYR